MFATLLTAVVLTAVPVAPASGPVTCAPGEAAPPNSWCDTVDPDPATVQPQLPEETDGRQLDCADGQVGRVQGGVLVCPAPVADEPAPTAAPAPKPAPTPSAVPAPEPRSAAVAPAPVSASVVVAPVVVEPVAAAAEVPAGATLTDACRAASQAVLGWLAAFLGSAR